MDLAENNLESQVLSILLEYSGKWISNISFNKAQKKAAKRLCKKGIIQGGYAKKDNGVIVKAYKLEPEQ